MCRNYSLLLTEQEMEVDPKQQIEDELRRVLNLNQDQPSLNIRQPEGSHCVSSATSLSSGDVHNSNVGSPSVASSPQSTVSAASPAGASKKIPTASSSSPSVSHFKQASSFNEASRRRKPRRAKPNSPQHVPFDAVGVTDSLGNGKNVLLSMKSSLALKPESPRMDASDMTSTMSADNASACSAVNAGLCTSDSSLNTATGANMSNSVRNAAKTSTNQRGAKASTRGRGFKKHTDMSVSTVPGRPPENLQSDDHIHDVCTSHVVLSEQLSSAANDNTGNVKSEPLPTADENVVEHSNAPVAKVVENVQQPAKKHEKGKICVH